MRRLQLGTTHPRWTKLRIRSLEQLAVSRRWIRSLRLPASTRRLNWSQCAL